jgi:hypothetical protein
METFLDSQGGMATSVRSAVPAARRPRPARRRGGPRYRPT